MYGLDSLSIDGVPVCTRLQPATINEGFAECFTGCPLYRLLIITTNHENHEMEIVRHFAKLHLLLLSEAARTRYVLDSHEQRHTIPRLHVKGDAKRAAVQRDQWTFVTTFHSKKGSQRIRFCWQASKAVSTTKRLNSAVTRHFYLFRIALAQPEVEI